ncbi:hypothetical protein BDV25DRAFT_167997 [Aspergillus avenaceus]|uniref:WD40-repeat-containing domain protein n=1 Tax=Aspergillus avenaceus TaxID=36643 RepID=A0A5N6U5Z6_ASPAV|nr:hypothetical protein BDV25DRAFT_167997 [Aspergillus avenaceus]
MPQTPVSATTVYLDQPPSCLQFCPNSPNHFIVGTYLLTETKDAEDNIEQAKTGSLQLWQLNSESNTFTQIQRVPLPYAVFDLHFHPRDPSILAIATSTGSIALFKVTPGPVPELTHLWTKSVHEDPSIPALFLAWTPQNWLRERDGFAVTFSDGRTSVFVADDQVAECEEVESFEAKQKIEVWFVALATARQNGEDDVAPFMFTGDDFGALRTCRFGAGEGEAMKPLIGDAEDRARHHTAGVTAILPLPLPVTVEADPVLLTGSYDEELRVYRASRRGEVLAEMGLGGGVWRLQLLRVNGELEAGACSFLVLASCMHGGTRVVRVTRTEGEWEIEVMAEFTEHESMNYASDVWKPDGGYDLQGKNVSELLCVSSSFYDRRLCLWCVTV